MMKHMLRAVLITLGMLLGGAGLSFGQTYPKTETINFPFSSSPTPATGSLFLRSNSPVMAFHCGTDLVLRKATLNVLLDWKGDWTDASAAVYEVTVTVTAKDNFPTGLPAASNIFVYSPIILEIDKDHPQAYTSIDITGIHATADWFDVSAVYVRTGSSEPVVEAVMNTKVYYTEEYAHAVSVYGSSFITLNNVSYEGTETKFSWVNDCISAPSYEFQLLRLFNTSDATSTLETTITPLVDWSKAMSIVTGSSLEELKLTITEGTGYYLWRVRPIGNAFDGDFGNSRNWGDWTNFSPHVDGYSTVISAVSAPHLFYYNQFDNDKNWIFTRSFVEGDAINNGQVSIGEAISYANGLQMQQQQQSRLKSEAKVIVNQTIYDYSGRPAITSMAAPLNAPTDPSPPNTPYIGNTGSLGYIASYLKNDDVVPGVYSAADFDEDVNYLNPEIMDTTTIGTGLYYSNGNTIETNVPSASAYPFSRTLFMRDGTSKPKEQSAPGVYHKLGNTGTNRHTTRNKIAAATDGEMIRVLGDEAPAAESVIKSLTTDANNETSISYISKEGNTIITCLSSPKSPSLDALVTTPAAEEFTLEYHVNDNTPYGSNGMRAFKTFALTEPADVHIDYTITPKIYEEACIAFCATCDYKVRIKITDNNDPGNPVPVYYEDYLYNPTSGLFGACEDDPITEATVTLINLPEGSYTVERIIEGYQVNTLTTGYPAVPNVPTGPAVLNTPFLDQYLKHIEKALRANYVSTTAVTITVYNNTNGVISTESLSMSALLGYLQPTPNISGLYTALDIVQNATVSLNPDHFDIALACDNVISIPVQWCAEVECPVYDATNSIYHFEQYYEDWYYEMHGTAGDISDLFPQYVAGDFDIIVTNMINATCGGYQPCSLLTNFKQIYMMSETIDLAGMTPTTGTIPTGLPTPSFASHTQGELLFDMFMQGAEHAAFSPYYPAGKGYEIIGINNSVGGLGCSSLGYKYHPHRYIKYEEADRCPNCELAHYAEINGDAATTIAFPLTYTASYATFVTYFNPTTTVDYLDVYPATTPVCTVTVYPRNDFFRCLWNTNSTACSATTTITTPTAFGSEAEDICEAACEDRFSIFVADLIAAYHASGTQVETDEWDLISDGSGGFIFDTETPHDGSGATLSQIYCEVEALIAECKTYCELTVQTDGSLGSATEYNNMANAMYGVWMLKHPTAGQCDSPWTTLPPSPGTGNSHTFDGAYYTKLLNLQLAQERLDAPANGFYWDYDAFLLGLLDATALVACENDYSVLVHPDIPSYFEYNSTSGKIEYVFNKEQAGFSLTAKPIFSIGSSSVIGTGTGGFGFNHGTAATVTKATALAADITTPTTSYFINSAFSPYVYAPVPSTTLIPLIAEPSATSVNMHDYNVSGAWWRFELCPTLSPEEVDCGVVCYQLVPPGAITDGITENELITYTLVSCEQETATEFLNIIYDKINQFVNAELNELRAEYHTQCIELAEDDLKVSYDVLYHHYTLYYYDRAGNLVKTVPPQGVKLTDASSAALTSRTQESDHSMVTEYAYNSLGQLVRQKTLDGGESFFWYDSKARLRFSQNAKQAAHLSSGSFADPMMSYTRYDELGRITEVGEFHTLTTPTLAQADDMTYPSTGTEDITVTVYTTPAAVTYFGNLPQRFLQNRVSHAYTDRNGNTADTDDQVHTYYSYDPHGNVEWLVQEVPEIGKSYIAYEYDLISGSVIKVRYNEELADKFFHRYTYDVEKRIKTAETSKDNFFWVNDAEYEYYLHGPLKRTVLGKDKVQGQDFVYTLQGWLKGMNHPDIAFDPGKDSDPLGNADVAEDAYSMMLGYYHGDYINNSSKFNADESANDHFLFAGSTRNLYNGNISSWTSRYNYEAIDKAYPVAAPLLVEMDVTTGRTFHYDELNRITKAAFNTFDGTNWTTVSDYEEEFTYDANGNIKTADRNGNSVTGLGMDALDYTYTTGKNQLKHVADNIAFTATYPADINHQATNPNYRYDPIGNLVFDDAEDIDDITWNVYGKITGIEKGDGSRLKFLYDASGKRVYKKAYNTSDPILTAATTYYSLDASGNPMAVYGRANTPSGGDYQATFTLQEQAVYGSDRLGLRTDPVVIRVVPFTSSVPPVIPASEPVRSSAFNYTIAPLNFTVTMIPSWPPTTANKGSATSLSTGITPVVVTNSLTPMYGVAGTNSAVYEDDCGYVVFKSMVMDTYNGNSNVALVYNRYGGLCNTVGLKDYSKGKSMFMRNPGNEDEYYYFTVGTDKKPYYHIFNAATGTTVSKNHLMDNSSYHFAMALIEDRTGPGQSQLYMKRLASGGSSQLVRFEITATGISAAQVMTSYTSGENSSKWSEMQVHPDGDQLLVGNNKGVMSPFHVYTLGGSLELFNLSADHATATAAGAYSLGIKTVARSFDYTPTGDHIIYQHIGMGILGGGAPGVKRITDALATTTFTYTGKGTDIRKGKNGNVYIANAITNQFFELTSVDITSWSSASYRTVVSGTAGQRVTGGLSLNRHQLDMDNGCTTIMAVRELGKKLYELKDHLGNVHAVINDRKISMLVLGVHDHYLPDIESVEDYYSFGAPMPGRSVVSSTAYRYGFNGKENDDEVKNIQGSQQDYGMRIYDPRLGKFLSVDPLTKEYPELTPYQFGSNSPIWMIDLDGLEGVPYYPAGLGSAGIGYNRGSSSGRGLAPTPYRRYMPRTYTQNMNDLATISKIRETQITYRYENSGGRIVRVPNVRLINRSSEEVIERQGSPETSSNASSNVSRPVYRNQGPYTANYQRTLAVKQAWVEERELVRLTGQGTRPWNEAEREELLKTGKVKGYEGHHLNTVKANPTMAGEPENIDFVRGRTEHLERHGGNFRNQKSEVPLHNRQEKIQAAKETLEE